MPRLRRLKKKENPSSIWVGENPKARLRRKPLPIASSCWKPVKCASDRKLNATAASLKEKGEPVIHLGGGEPKSKAPAEAIANCIKLLETGEVRYRSEVECHGCVA